MSLQDMAVSHDPNYIPSCITKPASSDDDDDDDDEPGMYGSNDGWRVDNERHTAKCNLLNLVDAEWLMLHSSVHTDTSKKHYHEDEDYVHVLSMHGHASMPSAQDCAHRARI